MGTLDSNIKSMGAQRTAVFMGSLTPDEINRTLFGTGDTAVVHGIPYDKDNECPGVATIGGNLLEVHNGDVVMNAGADTFVIIQGLGRCNADITSHVENRLKAENIPYERIHDSISVAPEHFAILQRITDEVMHEMVEQATTSTDAIRQRIQRKRELAEKCTRYYPVMQRCKGFSQQVAAAATVEGAVTIKDIMERRNRSEEYFIGPRTIIFSDELAALEFEPTEFERAEMEAEATAAAAKMNQSLQIDPEEMRRQLESGL